MYVSKTTQKSALDITRFGRCYWLALGYGTLLAILLPSYGSWLFAHVSMYMCSTVPAYLFMISIFCASHQLNAAKKAGDHSAILGNKLAMLISLMTYLFALGYEILHVRPMYSSF